jgi:eukaryotic-like serine/threonine-protein kinase
MLPERFGRYEVLAEIGEGAMGRVYSAWDPAVSRAVAIKTIKSEYLTPEISAEYLGRFRREAQAAGGLSHPSIVRVYDVGDGYLVMEHVEGRTLQQLIREKGRIEPEAVLRLLAPVAEAVDLAHRAGIVHRDIKPANIMVQPDGRPKLMDFGVAHVPHSVMTTAGELLGSPTYMPPEQIAGLDVTGRSDVYSLAVVAYEMLTGQPPFQGKTITQVIHRVIHDLAPPPRRWNADLPVRYDDVFARALAKDPAERFATAGDLVTALALQELEHFLSFEAPPAPAAAPRGARDDTPTLVSPPTCVSASGPGGGARVLALAVGAICGLVLLFVLAAAIWIVRRRGPEGPTAATVPPSTVAAPEAKETPTAPAPSPSPPASPSPAASPSPSMPALTRVVRPPKQAPAPTAIAPPPPATPNPTPEPVIEGQLVEMGPAVTPPVRIAGRPAAYPRLARELRQYGTVAIDLIVDETGAPVELQVVESAGPILDDVVLKAVRTWRFEPARKDGVRVKVRWQMRQTYKPAP